MIKQNEELCKLGESLEIQSIKHTCFQYNNQANNFMLEIDNNREHVMKIIEIPKTNSRNKRGLINLVGRLANVLFGVCDDADAEYFYDKIKELEISKSQIS